jgi:3-methyladenine DNA glycosylase AlkC
VAYFNTITRFSHEISVKLIHEFGMKSSSLHKVRRIGEKYRKAAFSRITILLEFSSGKTEYVTHPHMFRNRAD